MTKSPTFPMNTSQSTSTSACPHWYVLKGICIACKSKVVKSLERKPFNYLSEGLSLTQEAISSTKRLTTLDSLHLHKKLHLILDLDHTLLHSVKISNLSESEKYLIEESRQDVWNTKEGCLIIKLRPFLHEFLKEANELFDMSVYTKGSSGYARIVMKLIDPEMNYFGRRVITRKESPDLKTLDMVLVDERGIVIVDDSVESWCDVDKRNLLEIKKYFYFKCGSNLDKSYAEEKSDEKESISEGGLVNVLKLLKRIHGGFFSCEDNQDLDTKDVRVLLQDSKF